MNRAEFGRRGSATLPKEEDVGLSRRVCLSIAKRQGVAWISLRFISYFFGFVVPALSASAGTTNETFTRQVMLKSMAQNCIVPGILEIDTNANALCEAGRQLMDKPGPECLAGARAAWRQMNLACKRHEMLFYGPIKDQVFWQANFYPKVYPNLVEYLVSSSRPIDGGLIDRIGAPLKGFEASEYLLFAPLSTQMSRAGLETNTMTNPFVSWLLQGKFAQRRRQYLDAITRNLSGQLHAAAKEAQDKNFPDKFAAGGQKSVNLLVNQLTVTLEMDLILPLQDSLSPMPATRAHNNLRIGAFSGEFLPGMKVALEGLHRFYRGEGGTGLDDYVQTVNPNLNDRLEKQFEATAIALDSLKTPLDTSGATEHPEFQNALDEAHKLEVLLKVDLTSTLGVTIMFNAYDGD